MAKAFIVGVGPGDPGWLTDRARLAIHSEAVLGWELNLVPLAGLLEGKTLFVQKPDNYRAVAHQAASAMWESNGTIAIVRIGDALVSSGLSDLLACFQDFQIEVIPGISPVQLTAALARFNLDEAVAVSFHEERRWEEEQRFMYDVFQRGRHLINLTGLHQHPNEAAPYLIAQGVDSQTEALVNECLTLPDERIIHGTLGEIALLYFH